MGGCMDWFVGWLVDIGEGVHMGYGVGSLFEVFLFLEKYLMFRMKRGMVKERMRDMEVRWE